MVVKLGEKANGKSMIDIQELRDLSKESSDIILQKFIKTHESYLKHIEKQLINAAKKGQFFAIIYIPKPLSEYTARYLEQYGLKVSENINSRNQVNEDGTVDAYSLIIRWV